MDQMFWTCEMCGHKNRIGETFCSQCGHKATNFEISEALKHAGVKEESESDFTRIMKRADLPLTTASFFRKDCHYHWEKRRSSHYRKSAFIKGAG